MTTTPANVQDGILGATGGMRSRIRRVTMSDAAASPPITPTSPGAPTYGWQFEYDPGPAPDPMPSGWGSFDMTRSGTVPTVASGVTNLGRAGQFETVSDYYQRNDNIFGATPNDTSWSLVVWVKWRSDYLDNRAVRSGGGTFHFDIKWISGTPDKIQLRTTQPDWTVRTVEHNLTLNNSQFYMVDLFHDHTNDLMGGGVNAGSQLTETHVGGFPQLIGPGPFEIGRVGKTDIAAVWFWQGKILSAAERLFLYDGGDGYQF